MKNLPALYRSSLQAHTVKTAVERDEAYRLRYRVYCLERGFEPPATGSDKIETDAHDAHAVHFLARHRFTGNALGVTRLVIDNQKQPGSLPIEQHGIATVDQQLEDLRSMGHTVAEVSRLAVTRDLSQLCQCTAPDTSRGTPFSIRDLGLKFTATPPPPRIIPLHVSMGLLALLFKKSKEWGISHWVVLLDAALVRCYARFGIQGRTLGPAIDYKGLRQPLLISLLDVWSRIQERCPPLAQLVADFLARPDHQSHPVRNLERARPLAPSAAMLSSGKKDMLSAIL